MYYPRIFWFAVILILSLGANAKTVKKYYPSGELHFQESMAGRKKHGLTQEFYETGELKVEAQYNHGRLESKKKYRKDKKLEYKFYLEKGKKVEIKYTYHPSGSLFREQPFVGGKQEGLEKDYYPSGKKKAERTWIDGKKEGRAIGYYEHGQIQGDWEFEDGAPVDATIYHPNGRKNLVHEFKNGRIHGETKEYSSKGKLKAIRIYRNDKLMKRKRVK
ncbi:MAG: hypothetical protein GY862_11420 [Gammaproteobacteria bacterium]|nr:hypothetical protein [Gammaproteobacteria bacterium]